MPRPSASSPARTATAVSGVASTIRMIERERSELSRSRTAIGSRVARPALNMAVSSAIKASGTMVTKASRKGRRRSQSISRQNTSQKPGRKCLRASISASSFRPGDDRAHARAQALDRLRRHRANLEGTQIKIAGGSCGTPRRVLSLNIDHGHAHRDDLGLQRGQGDIKGISDLQPAEQILPQIEGEPDMFGVEQREQRRTGAEILTERSDTRRDLGGDWGADDQFADIHI